MLDKVRRNTEPVIDARPTASPPATALPMEPSTSENPVVAAARKANSAVRKHISNSSARQQPSVRILREPSSSSIRQNLPPIPENGLHEIPERTSSRRRSGSESHRPRWFSMFRTDGQAERSNAENAPLPTVTEEPGRQRVMVPRHIANELTSHMSPHAEAHGGSQHLAEHFAAHTDGYHGTPEEDNTGLFRRAGDRAETAVRWLFGRGKALDNKDSSSADFSNEQDEYNSDMVDLLDVLDPEVSTLSTLTNVQNSLFVPSLGRFLNRRPKYKLTARVRNSRIVEKLKAPLGDMPDTPQEKEAIGSDTAPERPPLTHTSTISSAFSESRYAVLPHGESLAGWTPEEKDMLDDLVRHMLHSRRARLKRSVKGFGQYIRRPLGLFITLYASLITIFGAAWVLFLIGWISLGSKRDYVINIVDNVLVALFAIIGDGLAPFRAVDTYHMIYIAHYYRKTRLRRKQLGLPELEDRNDLPHQREEDIGPRADIENLAGQKTSTPESAGGAPWEYSVLSEEEQTKLEYHERKFSKSHTFYKPHETATHYAFPLRLLIAIVLLLDCHSMLQITLGATTWGIPYKTRPFALTTVVLCLSISANITGGVLISVGDHRTRKKDVIERMTRQEITAEAKQQIEKRIMKEAEERGEMDRSERKEVEEEMEEEENEEIKKAWKRVPLLPKKLLGKGEDHREPSLPQESKRSTDPSRSRNSLDSSRKSNADRNIQPSHQASRKSTHREKRSVIGSSSAPIGPATSSDSSGTKLGTKSVAQSSVPPPQAVLEKPSLPKATERKDDEPKEGKREKIMKLIRKADMDLS